MRKKIIIIFISIIIFMFVSICIIVEIDKNNINDIVKDILENTDIKEIDYINKYDDSYIVVNNEYLYLLDYSYEEISKINISLIAKNTDNFDIIYRDKTIMYMDDYKNKDGVIFKYYDIYTYELIDTIVVGGN